MLDLGIEPPLHTPLYLIHTALSFNLNTTFTVTLLKDVFEHHNLIKGPFTNGLIHLLHECG